MIKCYECFKDVKTGGNLIDNGEQVCDDCLREYYFLCKSCNEYCHESSYTNDSICINCKN